MSGDAWSDAGFVVASTKREAVLRALAEDPATPSTIAESRGLRIGNVSRALSDMREEGLVELLVPEGRRKGRIYGITDAGEAAEELLDEVG